MDLNTGGRNSEMLTLSRDRERWKSRSSMSLKGKAQEAVFDNWHNFHKEILSPCKLGIDHKTNLQHKYIFKN